MIHEVCAALVFNKEFLPPIKSNEVLAVSCKARHMNGVRIFTHI
jgi:hypothetical protein